MHKRNLSCYVDDATRKVGEGLEWWRGAGGAVLRHPEVSMFCADLLRHRLIDNSVRL